MKNNKWNVWTHQINADVFTVEAETEKEARQKAKEQWHSNYGCEIKSIEKVEQR